MLRFYHILKLQYKPKFIFYRQTESAKMSVKYENG
jgi:hypothetical protein